MPQHGAGAIAALGRVLEDDPETALEVEGMLQMLRGEVVEYSGPSEDE